MPNTDRFPTGLRLFCWSCSSEPITELSHCHTSLNCWPLVCVCVCVVPVGIELCGCQGWRSFTERDSFVSCAFGGGCQKIRTNEHCFPPLRRLCLHPCPFVGLCVCWSVGWLHVWLVCQKDYAKKYCNIVSLDVFRHFCLPDFLKQICI